MTLPTIPDELRKALATDSLVVFAGAGVSMPMPTALPGVVVLRNEVERHIGIRGFKGIEYSHNDQSLEIYLSRLETNGIRIHKLLDWIFNTPKRKPNALHKEIVRLFRSPKDTRIVTTNYDNMFQEAIGDTFPTIDFPEREEEFYYRQSVDPHFHGIYHLNGCLHQPEWTPMISFREHQTQERSAGWPEKPLDPIFKSNVVLYIGYSHSDAIFNKYAEKIATNATYRQFALTHRNEAAVWPQFGVEPIIFEDFNHLPSILTGWANSI